MTGIEPSSRAFAFPVRFISALYKMPYIILKNSFLAYFIRRYWVYKFLKFMALVLSNLFTILLSKLLILEVHGLRIYAILQDGKLNVYDESYESHVVPFFEKLISKGSTVIDAGAALGYYTLLAAKLVGKEGRVIALEPNKTRAHYLMKAIKLNGFTNVEVYKAFASDSEGAGTITLDSLLKDADLVKMDIEGGELDALKGMKKILAKGRVKLICEVHPNFLPQGYDVTEIEDILSEYQYKIYEITREGLIFRNSIANERKHYLFEKR